jgi:hypothetical protein
LPAQHGIDLEVASEAPEFAQKVLALMDSARASRMGNHARVRVLSDCAWPASYVRLDLLLEPESAPPRAVGRALATPAPTMAASWTSL